MLRAGLLGNRLVLLGVAAEILLLLALLLVPPLAEVFGLAAPSLREWAPTLAFPPVMILLEEGRKWLARRRTPSTR